MFLREAGYDALVYVLDAKGGVFLVDDRGVDYEAIYKEREKKRQEETLLRSLELNTGLMSGEEFALLEGGGGGMAMRSYTVDELWLEITPNVNTNFVDLTLHNTRSNLFYQIHSTLGLEVQDWIPGQIFTNTVGLTNITFAPVAITNSAKKFFRAVASDTLVAVEPIQNGFEPWATNSISRVLGEFKISRTNINNDLSRAIDVPINVGGTASNGVDYGDFATFPEVGLTNLIPMDAFDQTRLIDLDPQEDDLLELDETVSIRVEVSRDYVIDPAHFQATITISEPPEKLFVPVAAVDGTPTGIDYFSLSNSLIVSLAPPNLSFSITNFVRIDTNGNLSDWSLIQGLPDEIKISIAHSTANGFTNGTLYFSSGANVGRLSQNGSVSNINWVSLTNSFGTNETLLRGSLYVDQSGSFGGKLLVVSGGDLADQGGGVWSLSATGGVTAITTIPDTHLEGLITLTNNPAKWGPWAGKMLVGGESSVPPAIFAISTNGVVMTNHLDIQPEDFDIIVTNQNLYCSDEQGNKVLKLSSNLFTNFVGDLLVTQEGFVDHFINGMTPAVHLPKLIVLHWDGTNFVQRASISRRDGDMLEHSTFAPMNIPPLP